MELGEMVAAAVPAQESDECPFDHEETTHDPHAHSGRGAQGARCRELQILSYHG